MEVCLQPHIFLRLSQPLFLCFYTPHNILCGTFQPNSPPSQVFAAMEQYDKAINDLNEAINLDSREGRFYYNRAVIKKQWGLDQYWLH